MWRVNVLAQPLHECVLLMALIVCTAITCEVTQSGSVIPPEVKHQIIIPTACISNKTLRVLKSNVNFILLFSPKCFPEAFWSMKDFLSYLQLWNFVTLRTTWWPKCYVRLLVRHAMWSHNKVIIWVFALPLTLPGPSAGVSGSLDSYCTLKPVCSGMGEVVPARTSPTLLPPSPRTVLSLSCFKVLQCINCRD